VQEVRRPGEGLRVANLRNVLEDDCCRSAQSRETLKLRCHQRFAARSVCKKLSERLEKS
jgi:hypothetical protein